MCPGEGVQAPPAASGLGEGSRTPRQGLGAAGPPALSRRRAASGCQHHSCPHRPGAQRLLQDTAGSAGGSPTTAGVPGSRCCQRTGILPGLHCYLSRWRDAAGVSAGSRRSLVLPPGSLLEEQAQRHAKPLATAMGPVGDMAGGCDPPPGSAGATLAPRGTSGPFALHRWLRTHPPARPNLVILASAPGRRPRLLQGEMRVQERPGPSGHHRVTPKRLAAPSFPGRRSGAAWPRPGAARSPRSGLRSTRSRVCRAAVGPCRPSPAEGRGWMLCRSPLPCGVPASAPLALGWVVGAWAGECGQGASRGENGRPRGKWPPRDGHRTAAMPGADQALPSFPQSISPQAPAPRLRFGLLSVGAVKPRSPAAASGPPASACCCLPPPHPQPLATL